MSNYRLLQLVLKHLNILLGRITVFFFAVRHTTGMVICEYFTWRAVLSEHEVADLALDQLMTCGITSEPRVVCTYNIG